MGNGVGLAVGGERFVGAFQVVDEGVGSMVVFLVSDVSGDVRNAAAAGGDGAVADLPAELGLAWPTTPIPLPGCAGLHFADDIGDGAAGVPPEEAVHVVPSRVHRDRRDPEVVGDLAQSGVDELFHVTLEQWSVKFGPPHEVHVDFCVAAAGHCDPPVLSPRSIVVVGPPCRHCASIFKNLVASPRRSGPLGPA